MTTKIEDKPIAHAGADSSPRCAVSPGSAPWSEQKRKRHREYMRTWNKNNRDKVNGYLRKYTQVHSVSPNKGRNRRSWKYAAHARKPWGVVEDALLFSGKTESELVHELGRSISAIQRRKWRLRQEDAQYSPNKVIGHNCKP